MNIPDETVAAAAHTDVIQMRSLGEAHCRIWVNVGQDGKIEISVDLR